MSKGGRCGKYHEWITEDGLLMIESWARDGLTDEQIANNMGIAAGTLYEWKKRFPEIDEAIKKGKRPVDLEVENALLKRALGYDYEEVKTLIEEVDGKKKKKVEKITKHVPADVTAAIFWLRNRKGFVWSNRDAIVTKRIEAEIEKLKAETEKLKNETVGVEPPKITIVDEWADDDD